LRRHVTGRTQYHPNSLTRGGLESRPPYVLLDTFYLRLLTDLYHFTHGAVKKKQTGVDDYVS